MVVEIRLWVFILFVIAFFLLLIHTIFGDLIGKALYNHLKHKENKEEENENKKGNRT